MEEKQTTHIHFIGICGVAMSALAIAFQKKGFKVTGSDVGFYPPVSTHLKNAGIEFYPGWHPEKMSADGNPDIVVVGNVAGSSNPEWQYVQEHTIEFKSYPEIIAQFFVQKKSIVCAGTYGKTTSSSLLAWTLKKNGFNPSYMFGGISLNDMPAAELADSEYSILEGDEYKSARWDNNPKFVHYSPTHLLLTSVVWDHADVYPTEQSYVEAFENLVKQIPRDGLFVMSAKVYHAHAQFLKLSEAKMVTYGKTEDNEYQYFDVSQTRDGITFKIKYKDLIFNLQSSSLGDYMADNMTGCFAMAHQLGIAPKNIIDAFSSFKNIRRRLEKHYSNGITIFDDIAHSPKKAEAVLRSLQNIYAGKIIAVFEPNTGNRQAESIPGYDNAFKDADTVIIPRLTKVKQDPDKPEVLEGVNLSNVISKTHRNTHYIEDDTKLLQYIKTTVNDGDVVIFLGSHGFRGMIEELVKNLKG